MHNVTCTNGSEMAAGVPALRHLYETFGGDARGGPNVVHNWDRSRLADQPRTTALNVGKPAWCWHNCDGPYLLWYARVGSSLQHIHFFWFLEWDVVWTGDIVAMLAAWSTINEKADTANPALHVPNPSLLSERNKTAPDLDAINIGSRTYDHDLLCANPGWARKKWPHRHKRNKTLVQSSFAYHCETSAFRLSPQLLSQILSFSRQPRAALFCEMRAATICAMHPWCTMRSLFDHERQHMFYTGRTDQKSKGVTNKDVEFARNSYAGTYVQNGGVNDSAILKSAHANRSLLFHAYKWQKSDNITAVFPP